MTIDLEPGAAFRGSARVPDAAEASFTPLRPTLARIAYRMLGSVADAQDVVQEVFVRWMRADRARVREPEAFLRQTATNLCLDVLKSARRTRETYLGPWLPDPVVEADTVEDVTLPLLLALERLSPLERAAFLLHDVFGLDFAEVASTIGRDAAACRQLAARARLHVREARPRFPVEKRRGLELATAFFTASRSGDLEALRGMLAEDVMVHVDGGGRRRAPSQPVCGVGHVIRLHRGLARRYAKCGSTLIRVGFVNGLPGFITREGDGGLQSTALAIRGGPIVAIYVVRNPDKLRHLQTTPGGAGRAA